MGLVEGTVLPTAIKKSTEKQWDQMENCQVTILEKLRMGKHTIRKRSVNGVPQESIKDL